MIAITKTVPWQHWIADNFLSTECLTEVKSVDHIVPQLVHGKDVTAQDCLLIMPKPNPIHIYMRYIKVCRQDNTEHSLKGIQA
jgi:hypothetical protein